MRNFYICLSLFFLCFFTSTAVHATDRIETNGELISVTIKDQKLILHGWTLPFDSALSISTLKVQFADKELYLPCVPAAKASAPSFVLSIPLSEEDNQRVRDSLICVTPVFFNDKEGNPIYYLFDCQLPMPTQAEVDLVGGGDLLSMGNHLLNVMVGRIGLKKTDDVLDVGCGVGRVAYPLAYYLSPTSRYEGFDIIPSLISRAQQCISPTFPNFHFQLANIYNSLYNPQGTIPSSQYKFPYGKNQFDFAFLTSVFTHMLPVDVRHYLSEIHRVLRPGGKCMVSCFLLNFESCHLLAAGRGIINVIYPYGECFVSRVDIPEAAVGYDEKIISKWITDAGFRIIDKHKGQWCGRTSQFVSFQDILVLEKVQ